MAKPLNVQKSFLTCSTIAWHRISQSMLSDCALYVQRKMCTYLVHHSAGLAIEMQLSLVFTVHIRTSCKVNAYTHHLWHCYAFSILLHTHISGEWRYTVETKRLYTTLRNRDWSNHTSQRTSITHTHTQTVVQNKFLQRLCFIHLTFKTRNALKWIDNIDRNMASVFRASCWEGTFVYKMFAIDKFDLSWTVRPKWKNGRFFFLSSKEK